MLIKLKQKEKDKLRKIKKINYNMYIEFLRENSPLAQILIISNRLPTPFLLFFFIVKFVPLSRVTGYIKDFEVVQKTHSRVLCQGHPSPWVGVEITWVHIGDSWYSLSSIYS